MRSIFLTTKQILKKLGGDKIIEKKAVLPATEATFDAENMGYVIGGELVGGNQYTITFNGTKYKCTAWAETDPTSVYIGNPKAIYPDIPDEILPNGANTSVPWMIAYIPNHFTVLMHKDGYIGDITISISEETETVHPIDPKYLPSGGGGGGEWVILEDYGFNAESFEQAFAGETIQWSITEEQSAKFAEAVQSANYSGIKMNGAKYYDAGITAFENETMAQLIGMGMKVDMAAGSMEFGVHLWQVMTNGTQMMLLDASVVPH